MLVVYTKAVDWMTDPAASGTRWRAHLDHGEMLVYVESGDWEVRLFPPFCGQAAGRAANDGEGKLRALAVYSSLTETLRDASDEG